MSHVENLPPGDELDALVAKYVLGLAKTGIHRKGTAAWTVDPSEDGRRWELKPLRPYSTDIAAAWDVVEKLKGANWWVDIHPILGPAPVEALWWVGIDGGNGHNPGRVTATGETAPLAICRAALLAAPRIVDNLPNGVIP